MENLNFMTPINRFGYGVTGINMLLQFLKRGIDVTLFPIGTSMSDPEHKDIVNRCTIGNRDTLTEGLFNTDAPVLRNFHEHEVVFPPSRGKKIVWPFFEVDKLRSKAVQLLKGVDAIACGSHWIEQVMHDHGLKSTFIAPQGVDTKLFKPIEVYRMDDKYTFLTIGKYEKRKGHEELIKAFLKAFPEEKDVQLWMACSNPFLERTGLSVRNLISVASNGDERVTYLPQMDTHKDISVLINKADCGVFPSRGEGWGLPILEVMACGKPVIATFVTSHKDFVTPESAFEVKTTGMEVANDNIFFKGLGSWYNPDVNSIVEHMRFVYENDVRSNEAGVVQAGKFTWYNAASKMIRGIDAL